MPLHSNNLTGRLSVIALAASGIGATLAATPPAFAVMISCPTNQVCETYTYDAQGRVVKVEHEGGPNDGVVEDYEYDDADNRTRKETSGA